MNKVYFILISLILLDVACNDEDNSPGSNLDNALYYFTGIIDGESEVFNTFFEPRDYPFKEEGVFTTEKTVSISFTNENGIFTSELGSQTESSFNIIESIESNNQFGSK